MDFIKENYQKIDFIKKGEIININSIKKMVQ